MSRPSQVKADFLSIPTNTSNRARSKTLTTPVGTPNEQRNEFISTEILNKICPPSSPTWNRLPRELKFHVLSFLSATDKVRCMSVSLRSAARIRDQLLTFEVNKEMQTIVMDGALWQTLDASSFYSKIPAQELLKLIERASPFVQHLNLRGCAQLKSSTTLNLTNLTKASFEGCRFLTADSITLLLEQNPRLKYLDLCGLTTVDDTVLLKVVQHCSSLLSLNISYCKNVSSGALVQLAQNLIDLRDLRIAESRVTLDVLSNLNKLKSLQRLSLAGCTALQDDWIKVLIYGNLAFGLIYPETRVRSSLQHLDLSRCSNLTGAALKYLRCVLPDLQKLELAGLSIDDISMVELLPTLPNLTHIDLEDCSLSDGSLLAMSSCRHLRHVQLSHCSYISDVGVLRLIDDLPLNHLDLDNTNVSDQVLSAIASKKQPIRISIYDCPHLSWTGVLSILTSNSANPTGLKKLKTFYGWQRPVDGHTKRCARGDVVGAKEIEREWATYMMESSEEIMRTGEGRTRFLDFDDQGLRIVGRDRRTRSRACNIM